MYYRTKEGQYAWSWYYSLSELIQQRPQILDVKQQVRSIVGYGPFCCTMCGRPIKKSEVSWFLHTKRDYNNCYAWFCGDCLNPLVGPIPNHQGERREIDLNDLLNGRKICPNIDWIDPTCQKP